MGQHIAQVFYNVMQHLPLVKNCLLLAYQPTSAWFATAAAVCCLAAHKALMTALTLFISIDSSTNRFWLMTG